MHTCAPPDRLDLVVVIDEFVVGGVASLYSTIVSAATGQGLRAAVVGRPGPAREGLVWGTAVTLEVAQWDREALDTVEDLLSRADRVVWQACPSTVPLLVSCMQHPRTTLVVHSAAAITHSWFGEDLVDLLVSALRARPSLLVMTPSSGTSAELASLFDLPVDRFRVLPHVSAVPVGTPRERRRPRPRVVVPTRISAEKRFLVLAGLQLARVRDLPLTVVGAGPDVEWVRAQSDEDGVEVELIEDPRIHDHIAVDDVVVAVGLVANEAARYCAAVVTASRAAEGVISGVVTPDTLQQLYDDNFLGGATDHLDPEDAWRQIERLTDEDRRQVQRGINELADPLRASKDLMRACDADDVIRDLAATDTLVAALVRAWLSQSGADRAWIADLVEARTWLSAQRDEHEAWISDLQNAIAFHSERADFLQAQYDAALVPPED